jgi:hypothetical protein
MTNKNKLFMVKLLHTFVWVVMTFATFYVLISVIIMDFNILFFVCLITLIVEIIVMIGNRFVCPFQYIASKFTNNRDVGFDIFLPKVIAKNNTLIFIILFSLSIILFILNYIGVINGFK